jgi:hypothetical protein
VPRLGSYVVLLFALAVLDWRDTTALGNAEAGAVVGE